MKEPVELSSLKAEVAELTEKVRSSEDKENQQHSDKVLFLPSLCTLILIPFSPLFSPFPCNSGDPSSTIRMPCVNVALVPQPLTPSPQLSVPNL